MKKLTRELTDAAVRRALASRKHVTLRIGGGGGIRTGTGGGGIRTGTGGSGIRTGTGSGSIA